MIAHYAVPQSGIFFYLYVVARIALLAAAPVIAFRLPDRRTPPETPLEILNKRFERGEISWEEYERMLREHHADWGAT